jgi:hypothetical protein
MLHSRAHPENQTLVAPTTTVGWSPTVADSQFWRELVAATEEFSCPSVGRNLAATGEDLMSGDRRLRTRANAEKRLRRFRVRIANAQ